MSEIDQVLAANRVAACGLHLPDGPRPGRHLLVLTCMDTRLDPYKALGLKAGEAHILRNAGGIVTNDMIRSLVLSHRRLGTRELMVIGHTNCGLFNLDSGALRSELEQESGCCAGSAINFHAFDDLAANVGRQVAKVRAHPWLSELLVRGFIYDVEQGSLIEVQPAA